MIKDTALMTLGFGVCMTAYISPLLAKQLSRAKRRGAVLLRARREHRQHAYAVRALIGLASVAR